MLKQDDRWRQPSQAFICALSKQAPPSPIVTSHTICVRTIRRVAAEPDVFRSVQISFSNPSEEVEDDGGASGHGGFSHPSFSQSADKKG